MPTYAYACSECDHRFEARQSFSEAALSECPQCSGRVRKLFNTVGIVFKGSGFYRTDSRGSAPKADDKSSSSTDKPSSSTSDSSSSSSTGSSSSSGSSSSEKKPAAAGASPAA